MEDVLVNEEEGKDYLDSLHMNSTLITWKYEAHPTLTKDTQKRIDSELNTNILIDAFILPHYDPKFPNKLCLSRKKMSKIDFVIKFLK